MRILLCYSTIGIVRGESSSTSIKYFHKDVFINTTEESINQLAIGYIIDPRLHVNKVFRYQA